MHIRRWVVTVLCATLPGAAVAWPFDKARSDYRKTVAELQCCFATDSSAGERGAQTCAEPGSDASLEDLRERHLCQWNSKQSLAAQCDYEEIYARVSSLRDRCLEEHSASDCGEARERGIEDAGKDCPEG